MELLGFALAIVMGFTLGLLGGGGSILTVPILVYVMSIEPVLATAYSLFVVGAAASIGGIRKYFEGHVVLKTGILFAIPSLIAVFLTRYKLVPMIPDEIFTMGSFTMTKNIAMMVFFAIVMLLAAFSMMRNKGDSDGSEKSSDQAKGINIPLIILEGLVVGVVTGLVGAGGGFLIVPALVLLVNMPIKQAVGTSLVIIALKSLIGFTGDIGSGAAIDWPFLLLFTGFSVIGIFIGIFSTRFFSPLSLKKSFGWFILVMGVAIMSKEILPYLHG